jgi:hypothetical protein
MKIVDAASNFRRCRRRNRSVHDFAVLGQGTLAEVRHGLTRWC